MLCEGINESCYNKMMLCIGMYGTSDYGNWIIFKNITQIKDIFKEIEDKFMAGLIKIDTV